MRTGALAAGPRKPSALALGATLAVAVLGAACKPAPAVSAPTPAPTPRQATAVAATPTGPSVPLSELSYVLGVKAGTESKPAANVDAYRSWIRARLAEPEIYDALTSVLTTVGTTNNAVAGFLGGPIKSDKGRDYYFHNADRCTDKDLVAVRPWWDMDHEVLVCKKDYRPERLIGKLGNTACDVTYNAAIHASQECGCGPNLIFCAPMKIGSKLDDAMVHEVRDTIRYVVESDRPFGDILTIDKTMRSGAADFWYNRVEFFRTGKLTPPDLATPPRLMSRPEYFSGGILSTFPMLYADGPRANTASLFADFLCTPMRSASVLTERVVEVAHSLADKQADIRAEPVLDLAKTEGCQNCHAKLEYGFIARGAWKANLNGLHLSSAPPKHTTTRFYVRSHMDLRGEGPATLGWFGETMSKQPEFQTCMTSKIATWVYEGQSAPAEVMTTLLARFERGQNMRQLIEDAVVARAFGLQAIEANSTGKAP